MKRKHNLVLVPLLGAAMALTACGSDDGDTGSDAGDSGSGGDAAGKIGVILPDTESSVRWESADRPALEAAFKEAGVEYDIQNAEGDAERMTQIADSMIADGVTVLAIVNLDSDSGAAIQEKAASQGVKTIDYDRLTLGGSADVLRLLRQHRRRRAAGPGPRGLPRRRGGRTSSTSTARRPTTTRRCSPRARTACSTR